MALQDDVNLVRVINRRELRAEQDAVGVGVILAAAVDVYNGTLVKTITRDFYNESGGCCRCFQ